MRDLRDIVRCSDTVELIRHELATPVAAALLYLGIAESYARRLPSDAITPALAVVRSEVQRLKALIDRMVEWQRSGPVLRPRFLDVGATVRSTVKRLLTTFAGTEGVTLECPSQTVQGWWDQTTIEQIVTNLLTNALKFGQGRAVRVTVREARSGVTISVRDQGIGISATDRLRLFKRNEHAPPERGGGAGLGLWLVRELALAHGGRVTVQSRKGRGTTFTVLLRARPPVLGAMSDGPRPRLPAQRSPLRTVSNRPAREPIPAYWQERLAKSQVKAALLPRSDMEVAPIATMISPSLTANLKSKWPSRTRKSNEESVVRASVPRRPLNRNRNFASPTLRGSGP
jgi:anti-sigma regulatory factor (Ser/Thr protein kinase)